MAKPALDVAAEIARLESLAIDQLREEWRRLHQTPSPKRLSRDILLRGITYRLQENVFGGLSKAILRKLQSAGPAEASPGKKRRPRPSFKPGTRLVREWHGVTHTVVILADGVEWRGQRYRSLSVVAREITGAHWSGPRFFGLKARRSDDWYGICRESPDGFRRGHGRAGGCGARRYRGAGRSDFAVARQSCDRLIAQLEACLRRLQQLRSRLG